MIEKAYALRNMTDDKNFEKGIILTDKMFKLFDTAPYFSSIFF